MAVSGMSICKPAEGSGDKKDSGWQTFQAPKVQGHEGFFFKPERKMKPTLCNCIMYTAINQYSYSPLVEAEKNCPCAFQNHIFLCPCDKHLWLWGAFWFYSWDSHG